MPFQDKHLSNSIVNQRLHLNFICQSDIFAATSACVEKTNHSGTKGQFKLNFFLWTHHESLLEKDIELSVLDTLDEQSKLILGSNENASLSVNLQT
jgi:hypothetical protein